jgi:hypothetical protein
MSIPMYSYPESPQKKKTEEAEEVSIHQGPEKRFFEFSYW